MNTLVILFYILSYLLFGSLKSANAIFSCGDAYKSCEDSCSEYYKGSNEVKIFMCNTGCRIKHCIAYLIAIASAFVFGAIKATDAVKCHPYYRVCVQNCKVKHGGNVFMKNMCVGGCKLSQCVIKRTDDKLSLED